MISIIVPVYNCMNSLERCVTTIVSQTWKDWELLLIDDGSTDGSGALCDELAKKHSNLSVFHQPNSGVSSARNLGLDHARGSYVMFCDSDDWVVPDWCEYMRFVAEKYSDHLPVCAYFRNTSANETINDCNSSTEQERLTAKEDFFSLNRNELLGIPWNKIFRRDIIEKNGIRFQQSISLGEDMVFVLDYLHHLKAGIVIVNRPLYHYYLGNNDSLSKKYVPDLHGVYRLVYSRIREELCAMPGVFEKWKQEYLYSYFYAFERVFRNTWSNKNKCSIISKLTYNSCVFHSKEFQECKQVIPKEMINKVQYYGLKTNVFWIYWLTVVVSETIHRFTTANQ